MKSLPIRVVAPLFQLNFTDWVFPIGNENVIPTREFDCRIPESTPLTVDGRAVLEPSLRRNIVFAQHNLVSDRSFNEFNVVFCRNVLIYFNRSLQGRVHRLFYQSLVRFGFLALGAKETVQFSAHQSAYEDLGERIYRKVA